MIKRSVNKEENIYVLAKKCIQQNLMVLQGEKENSQLHSEISTPSLDRQNKRSEHQ